MTRLHIGPCHLGGVDKVRHPPITNPIGMVLSYSSEVEVELDMLVSDALAWGLNFHEVLMWAGRRE